MDYLDTANQFLIDQFGPMGPLYAVGALGVLLVLLALPLQLMLLEPQVLVPLLELVHTEEHIVERKLDLHSYCYG